MYEMHLLQSESTKSACEPHTKNRQKLQKCDKIRD